MDYAGQRSSRVFVTSLVLFCIGLSLTAFSARNPAIGRLGSAVVEQLLYPFQAANEVVVSSVSDGWNHYINLVGATDENVLLKARVNILTARNIALHEAAKENERLRQILELSVGGTRVGVVADVIGYDPSQWVQAITVNRGLAHGVHAGMGVLFADAVVGQVTSAATHSSRVLLITDHASGTDAILQESRVRGVLRGKGVGRCSLEFVERKEKITEGARVVTSGMDQVFPRGLSIGKIYSVRTGSEAMFHSVQVEPTVDFSKLETVFIVTGAKVSSEQPKPASLDKPSDSKEKK